MLKLLVILVKLSASLALLYYSVASGFPIFLFVSLVWCGWLWLIVPYSKWRRLATLGLGLIALGWWFCSSVANYFLMRVETDHFGNSGWANMSHTSSWVGLGLAVAGIVVLAFADYLRPPKSVQASGPRDDIESDEDHTWPPAPKQSQ